DFFLRAVSVMADAALVENLFAFSGIPLLRKRRRCGRQCRGKNDQTNSIHVDILADWREPQPPPDYASALRGRWISAMLTTGLSKTVMSCTSRSTSVP